MCLDVAAMSNCYTGLQMTVSSQFLCLFNQVRSNSLQPILRASGAGLLAHSWLPAYRTNCGRPRVCLNSAKLSTTPLLVAGASPVQTLTYLFSPLPPPREAHHLSKKKKKTCPPDIP